jgi:hypothetical protein
LVPADKRFKPPQTVAGGIRAIRSVFKSLATHSTNFREEAVQVETGGKRW